MIHMFLIVAPNRVPEKHFFLEVIYTPQMDTLFRILFLAAAILCLGTLLWIAHKRGGK